MRAKILIDSIDKEILEKLSKKNYFIMELVEKIRIQHNNFLPHLRKLEIYSFIKIEKCKVGYKKTIRITKKGGRLLKLLLK